MDKRVIFAVAGAGKTTYIVSKLEESTRALIVTYTNNNLYNLKKKIKEKFGYIPDGIKVISYFSFLYGFCYRPFLLYELKTTGILYESNQNMSAKKTEDRYYISPSRRLYSNRVALLVQEKELLNHVRERIKKYYDLFIVDEVQDLSAHDFNLLLEITKAEVEILLVGDFFQYTYATSRDGNVRRTLHNNFETYKQQFAQSGLTLDETSLVKSYRCSLTTCKFVSENLGIRIDSHNVTETDVRELEGSEIEAIMNNNEIVKLFYQNASKYEMLSRNWGDSKGEDRYLDVCVVLNPNTYTHYRNSTLTRLNNMTKNKLYVALTRAKRHIYFIEQSKLNDYKRDS